MAEAWRLEEDEEELRELGRRHRRVALSSAAGEGRGRGGPWRCLVWVIPAQVPGSEFPSGTGQGGIVGVAAPCAGLAREQLSSGAPGQ